MKKLLVVLIIIFTFFINVEYIISKSRNLRRTSNLVIFEEMQKKEICSKKGLEIFRKDIEILKKKKQEEKIKKEGEEYKITFYTLSVASCSKPRNHPQYGITRTGYDLKGKDWTCRVISVDPSVIPLNTKVYIVFSKKELQYLNGEYLAKDTGNGIKYKHIDLYLGEFSDELAFKYGVQYANVKIIK